MPGQEEALVAGRRVQVPGRLEFLDSTRGIAAAVVLLHHAYESHPVWLDVMRFSPLRIFLTARAPVIFFFVLSGFVLSYGIWGNKKSRGAVPRFLMRRIVRIYIPYVVAATIALCCYTLLHPTTMPAMNTTFNAMWSNPLSTKDVLDHFALVGTDAANSLNVPAWSLVYELRISIFIPLICFAITLRPRTTSVIAAIVFVLNEAALLRLGLEATPYGASGLVPNLVVTIHFVGCFIVGAYLARMCHLGLEAATSLSAVVRKTLWIAAAALLMINRDLAIFAGASLLLYLCLTSARVQTELKRPSLTWLGRISFSLYLTHMIVIETFVRATQTIMRPALSLPIAVLLSLVVAVLFYWAVERPAHNLARSVDRVWRKRADEPSDASHWSVSQSAPLAFAPAPERYP